MNKTERIIMLLNSGFKSGEIYQKMRGETTYGTIITTVSKYRKANGILASDERTRILKIAMNGGSRAILALEAEERNMTPEALVRTLILAICDDDLFKAVLDK